MNRISRIRRSIFLALIFSVLPVITGAQSIPLATVGLPDVSGFPNISAYVDVRNGQGDFVSGLTADNIVVVENEIKIPASDLIEIEQGAQFVVALNPGTTFAIRDVDGFTRYDYLISALISWATVQPEDSLDVMSLIATASPPTEHVPPQAWAAALQAAPTDHRNAVSNIQSLSLAIDTAADPTDREGMGKAVLFITPNPETDDIPDIRNMEARALASGVRIHVWVVASPNFFATQGTNALAAMAQNTGGTFFGYSGVEPIPDFESYLAPLRSTYQMHYTSQILGEGPHEVAVEVATPSFTTRSVPQAFDLDILPPNPILISPPTALYRSILEGTSQGVLAYAPEKETIDILIEFPDGIQRELVRTTLYVDGQIAAENTAPPFDTFDWDLDGFLESGQHSIRVEAVDEFGLSSLSLDTPIDITVQIPVDGFSAAVSESSAFIAAVVVVMAGAVVMLVLVLTGRIRPRLQPVRIPIRRKRAPLDPVTQPVPAAAKPRSKDARRRLSRWANRRLPWPHREGNSEPYAFLERLLRPSEMEEITPTRPIPITVPEITIGTDPTLATLVVEDSSIEPLHARLRKSRNGHFTLSDHNTAAGTWVNYNPAKNQETPVQHGDIIHVGRIGFRFKLNQPPQSFATAIILEETDL